MGYRHLGRQRLEAVLVLVVVVLVVASVVHLPVTVHAMTPPVTVLVVVLVDTVDAVDVLPIG